VVPGSPARLGATKHLARTTTACPPWCDREHELTGDDRGGTHHCAITSAGDDLEAPVLLNVHLRAKEPVDAPGTPSRTEPVVFPEGTGDGWMIELPADVRQLQALRGGKERVDAGRAAVRAGDSHAAARPFVSSRARLRVPPGPAAEPCR